MEIIKNSMGTIENINSYNDLLYANNVTIQGNEISSNDVSLGEDVLDLTCQNQNISLPSENYTNTSKSSLTLHYEHMCKIRTSVNNKLIEYFSNDSRNIDDLKAYYKEVCKSEGTGNLQESYDLLLNTSVGNASGACILKGKEIASEYNHTGDADYIYYNSDYYYALEEAKVVLKKVTDELTEEYNVDKVNTNGTESRRELTTGLNYNFNETWNWNSKDIVNRCTMIDTSSVPPKNFSLFYKESKYNSTDRDSMDYSDAQKGVLEISNNNLIYKTDILFNNSLDLGEIKLIYNVSQLIPEDTKNTETDEYKKFISNFNVYTRQYDFFYIEQQNR